MELYDWITMLVPLMFEGILLAVFSKLLDKNYNRINGYEERKRLVEDDFWNLVMDSKKKLISFHKHCSNPCGLETLQTSCYEFYETIQGLYENMKVNSVVLKAYKPYVDKISGDYQELADVINDKRGDIQIRDMALSRLFTEIKMYFEEMDKIYYSLRDKNRRI